MSDALTRAIAEALGCEPVRYGENDDGSTFYICDEHGVDWPCDGVKGVAAALAPLIEARVREARAEALTEVADSLYVSATNVERANGGATERTKFMRDMVDVLRNRSREVRRG